MATKKTFEELLNRLETIVDEMESMDIGIEKAVKLLQRRHWNINAVFSKTWKCWTTS